MTFLNRTWTKIQFFVLALGFFFIHGCSEKPTLKIGILHSLSGTMALSEQAVVNATLMAIDEINQSGGLLGKQVEAIIADGASDPQIFAQEAKRLIQNEKVEALFACWTSRCRKAIKPIVEKNNHLLFYPVQFEGLEESNHIVYLGSSPNQQIIPGINWVLGNLGKNLYLIGSDYIYPKLANRIIRDLVYTQDGKISNEQYIPLNSKDMDKLILDIQKRQPDVIINNINGNSNTAFFKALKSHQLNHIPVMSFSISEQEAQKIGSQYLAGQYVTWSYIQDLNTPQNQKFIKNYRQRYGLHLQISDPMVSAYSAVKLWAQTVHLINSSKPNQVRHAIGRQSFNSPSGIISIDPETGYSWKKAFIAQFQDNGQLKLISSIDTAIRPYPYPPFHSKKEWKSILKRISPN